jgi:hypothetical protein
MPTMPRIPTSAASGPIALQLQAWPVTTRLPDADTDVLIWDRSSTEGQLGALNGVDPQGQAYWVDAQGAAVHGVTHWADMPVLTGPRC